MSQYYFDFSNFSAKSVVESLEVWELKITGLETWK